MKRSSIQRSTPRSPRAKSLATRAPRDHAESMLLKLQEHLYRPEEWGMALEVRSAPDAPYEVLRRADALAMEYRPRGGGWCFHFFEVKTSRADWLRELQDPTKTGPLVLFCNAAYFVVSAPWKNVVAARSEIPAGYGLLEVGAAGVVVVEPAPVRVAETPTRGFVRAFMRASFRRAERLEPTGGAPLMPIAGRLSREHVELACGHRAACSLSKQAPPRVPCFGCLEGLPTHREVVEAALRSATPEDLEYFTSIMAGRTPGAGLASTRPSEPRADREVA